ncbi:hypothetical protein ACOQFO_02360 [Ureibacillus sp. MALMAid1270]|uniref:hypothetical protein n=1 Tax=Ureibacillus sp. MALMAid1270 TaxID=3411629 RepID=UPI003BA6B55D
MNLWLSILILFIWVFVHSAIRRAYYWKSSIVSLIVYTTFVFYFYNEFPFPVMFVMLIIFFVLMTLSSYLQRVKYASSNEKVEKL